MKLIGILASVLLVSGCYTTSTSVYTQPTTVYNQPTTVYSQYSPPVVVQQPVCYWKTVPEFGYRQVVHQPDGNMVVIGSAIGAATGAELAKDNEVLGAVVGAIVAGSIANTQRVTTERVVIGSTQQKVCNRY